jgi:hypothetical protein
LGDGGEREVADARNGGDDAEGVGSTGKGRGRRGEEKGEKRKGRIAQKGKGGG